LHDKMREITVGHGGGLREKGKKQRNFSKSAHQEITNYRLSSVIGVGREVDS